MSLQNLPCVWCKEKNVSTPRNRFCSTSCSAKWRMRQPEIRKKIYNEETARKISISHKHRYKIHDPIAEKNRERIRSLNPTSDPLIRKKISIALKKMNWKPPVRGGNGHPMTVPQSKLLKALGKMWVAEHAISLGKRQAGYPTCYKVDIAWPEKMIAIEVDGYCHLSRKELDLKKDKKLNSLGWTILRFTNKEILETREIVIRKIYSTI